jgi:hypothetical protein
MEWITLFGHNYQPDKIPDYSETTMKYLTRYFYVTNVYAPCDTEGRTEFIEWFMTLDYSLYDLWIVMGDFNMIRSTADRNRLGGNLSNILHFNSIIQEHDLEEIPLKGRNYTWSNMQDNPLLEKLDWIFTSHNWTVNFPNTLATPMARLGSDHVPILIQVGTDIPRAQIFRFEEYWMDFDGFSEEVEKAWFNNGLYHNAAQDITARFKNLRHALKKWSKNISKLSRIMDNCSYVLALLDGIEEQRILSLMEKKFKKNHQETPDQATGSKKESIGEKELISDGQS